MKEDKENLQKLDASEQNSVAGGHAYLTEIEPGKWECRIVCKDGREEIKHYEGTKLQAKLMALKDDWSIGQDWVPWVTVEKEFDPYDAFLSIDENKNTEWIKPEAEQ